MFKSPESRIKTAAVGSTSIYLAGLAFVGINSNEAAVMKHRETASSAMPNVLQQQSLIGKELPQRVASRSRQEMIPKVSDTKIVEHRTEHHKGARNFLAPTSVQLHILRDCESGSNYQYNDGQFYGAYNFDLSTWHGL